MHARPPSSAVPLTVSLQRVHEVHPASPMSHRPLSRLLTRFAYLCSRPPRRHAPVRLVPSRPPSLVPSRQPHVMPSPIVPHASLTFAPSPTPLSHDACPSSFHFIHPCSPHPSHTVLSLCHAVSRRPLCYRCPSPSGSLVLCRPPCPRHASRHTLPARAHTKPEHVHIHFSRAVSHPHLLHPREPDVVEIVL